MKILFVCSRNKWRSRTAESIFKNNGHHQIKSAGTASSARIKLDQKMLKWANLIYVMEIKHKKIILKNFSGDDLKDKIEVLDIPDEYRYMDAELVELLRDGVGDVLRE